MCPTGEEKLDEMPNWERNKGRLIYPSGGLKKKVGPKGGLLSHKKKRTPKRVVRLRGFLD